MIGHIESYDEDRQTGVIKCEDKFYEFHIDEWNLEQSPIVGNDVDFLPEEDGSATNIGPVSEFIQDTRAVKNHYLAGILGLLFGALGIHRFYLGSYKIAFLQLGLTIGAFFAGLVGYALIWGFIDGFLILSGHVDKDGKGRPLK